MDLVSIAENPVPEGATVGTLRTSDDVALRFARWPAPEGRKGTVCIFQGRAEFIEKYFETVLDLRKRGFAAATLDWRGQGLSSRGLRDRRKGHVGDFAEYDRDLEAFMQQIVLPDCPPPYFALAHSMGATVLIRAAEQGRRWFDRTVLSAPMLGIAGTGGKPWAPMAATFLRRVGGARSYVPGGGAALLFAQPFEGNVLTSDPVRYARAAHILKANPDLGLGSPTIGWLWAAYREMAAMADPAYPLRLRHPLLLIGAGKDQVVSNTAIEQFGIRLRAGAHVMVPGSRHELLMEQDHFRDQFWAAFDAFVPGSE